MLGCQNTAFWFKSCFHQMRLHWGLFIGSFPRISWHCNLPLWIPRCWATEFESTHPVSFLKIIGPLAANSLKKCSINWGSYSWKGATLGSNVVHLSKHCSNSLATWPWESWMAVGKTVELTQKVLEAVTAGHSQSNLPSVYVQRVAVGQKKHLPLPSASRWYSSIDSSGDSLVVSA